MAEKWMLMAKKADFYKIGETFGISPVTARLMVNRGVKEDKDIQKYLYGDVSDMYSPYTMKDLNKAVALLKEAKEEHTSICIASDFDVDGIFSSFILYTGLKEIGADAHIDTPNRMTEGYGLNNRIVQDAYNRGDRLILTCDNGIAALESVAYAKSLGMTVIVTDHHEVPFEQDADGKKVYLRSEADAVVNPKQQDCRYPFKNLCGAGVAYKVIQGLYKAFDVEDARLYELLQYAAIATVADVMDLVDENRIIVKRGLYNLGHTSNKGLLAIMKANQLNPENISAYHVGFVIGPCFNAAGRLDTVKMALDLLMADNEAKADMLAVDLKALNDSRKEMTIQGTEQAIEKVETTSIIHDKIVIVLLENCHESLVGIIAGRLRERYHKPAICLVEVEGGRVKGSARSIEAYNMFENLSRHRHLFDKVGGHPMAAGMTLKKENLEVLRQKLNEETTLTEDDFIPRIPIDVPMPVGYITEDFINELELLEPFGKGNTKPVFAQKHFSILGASILGKNKNVLKVKLLDDNYTKIDGIFFGDIEALENFIIKEYGKSSLEAMYRREKNNIDIAFTYYPGINEFRGVKNIQIVLMNYCRIQK